MQKEGSKYGRLQINLLGKPEVWLDGALLSSFSTAKTEALLYYLATTGQSHSRETLAGLLWAEMPEAKARRNLTKSLSVLRRLLAPFLLIEAQQVGFDLEKAFELDVAALEAAVSTGGAVESVSLSQAVARFRGDFLAGFYVKDALAFEEWMLAQRERLREQALGALELLVTRSSDRGTYAAGIQYGRRLLELDPWRESAHRQMMVLLTNSGRRSDAIAQFEKLAAILDEEMGVEPMPETRALYDRLLRLERAVRHNLPPEPDLFVGRADERERTIATLNNPACRLLSLVGPGGIGKTRLALHAAQHFTSAEQVLAGADFNDGIYFVDLSSVFLEPETTRPEQIASLLATAVAEAMQIPLRSAQKPWQQLFSFLADKRVLLVIDNFEEWLSGAYYLGDLLRHAAGVKLLVTSRERLNLRQEWVLEIDGLPFPVHLDEAQLEGLAQQLGEAPGAEMAATDAVTLFLHHARRVNAEYQPAGQELGHILHICQLVEGSPLALELAAGWLRLLSGGDIVAEIEKSLDFLAANTRDVPPRHRSMRAVFDHSWEMLEAAEQKVLQQLSVFRGGFDRTAAERVASATLPLLAQLVNKSWLRVSKAGRYRLHELVRQYTAEKVAQGFEGMLAARDRHSRHYAHFVERHIAHLYSSALPEAIAALAAEIGNIRAGWRWATIAEYDGVLADIGHYVRALRIFYGRRGLFHEGLQMCQVFIERVGPQQAQELAPPTTALLGQLRLWEGLFHHYLGDIAAATICFGRSLELLPAQPADAPYAVKDLAGAHHLLGMVERRRGNYQLARQAFLEAERLDASLDDPGYAAKSAAFIGILDLEMGHYEAAQRQLEQCLPILRQNRDYYYSSMALGALAQVRAHLEQPLADVVCLLQQNLADSRGLKSDYAAASTLAHLGTALFLSGGEVLAEAKAQLEDGLEHYERIQTPLEQLQVHYWLAGTDLALGLTAGAVKNFRVCIEAGQQYGLLPLVIDGLVGLVMVSRETETPQLTSEQVDAILTVAQEHTAASARTRAIARQLSRQAAREKQRERSTTLEQIVSDVMATAR